MQQLRIAVVALVFTVQAHAASFDCAKSATFVEKSICADKKLNRLDDALADNYRAMLAANIGDGAKKDLKATQRNWMLSRNKCADTECIAKAYMSRLDEVCDYPVLAGVHPACVSADDIDTELAPKPAAKAAPQPPKQATPSQATRPNRTGGNQTVEDAANKNAAKIAALGFSAAQLQAMIYTKNDLVNPYQKFITLEGLLGLLFEIPRVTKITVVESGNSKGFLLKGEGVPSSGFLFRFEGSDAFLSHVVNGDRATRFTNNEEIHGGSLVLMQLAAAGIKGR